MKKILAAVLAMSLSASLSMGVLADEDTSMSVSGNQTAKVKATYEAGAVSGTIYKIDISWGSMNFTYNEASGATWNTKDHVYTGGTAANWTWENGANVINVTNHSNANLLITSSYRAESAYSSAGMGFSADKLKINSADNGTNGSAGTAQTGTIQVTPSGTLPKITSATQIGTITLQIANADTVNDGMLYHVGDIVNRNNRDYAVYSATEDTAYLITKTATSISAAHLNDYIGSVVSLEVLKKAYELGIISVEQEKVYMTATGAYKLNNGTFEKSSESQGTTYNIFLKDSINNKK